MVRISIDRVNEKVDHLIREFKILKEELEFTRGNEEVLRRGNQLMRELAGWAK
tara:strand:+ start:2953 stop:3111 length:159 start_codon:yes stop_codon:yes gene_type:complete